MTEEKRGFRVRGSGFRERESSGSSPALPAGFVFVDEPAEFSEAAALIVRVPAGIRSKEKLLAVLADKLRFPGYFGWNWDALEECLCDLSWLPAGKAVVLVHEDLPFGAGGENRGIYLAILGAGLDHWAKEGGRRLQVVMPAGARHEVIRGAAGRR